MIPAPHAPSFHYPTSSTWRQLHWSLTPLTLLQNKHVKGRAINAEPSEKLLGTLPWFFLDFLTFFSPITWKLLFLHHFLSVLNPNYYHHLLPSISFELCVVLWNYPIWMDNIRPPTNKNLYTNVKVKVLDPQYLQTSFYKYERVFLRIFDLISIFWISRIYLFCLLRVYL